MSDPIVIDVVGVNFLNTSTGRKAIVYLQVLDGSNAGIYRAIGGLPPNVNDKPIVVFNMNTLNIERNQGNAFHVPGQEPQFNFPLVNGQEYDFFNQSATPVLFGILGTGDVLVNSRTDGGSQSGDTNNVANYLTVQRFEHISFTLDTSVLFPSLITVSETISLPPPRGCCPGVECQPPVVAEEPEPVPQ